MAKDDFQNGGRPPSGILKNSYLVELAVIEFLICCCTPNFIKIE